ncbi:hypothetical protein Tco_1107950 [Tanacetum coccineum]
MRSHPAPSPSPTALGIPACESAPSHLPHLIPPPHPSRSPSQSIRPSVSTKCPIRLRVVYSVLLHVNLFIEISIEERQFLDFICTQAHRFIVRGYGDRILLALMSVQGGKLADPLQELTGSRRKWMLLVGVQSAFASQRSPEESELLAETRCVDLSIISFRFGLLLGQFACHCTTVVASPPPSCSTIGEKFIAKQVDKRKKKKLEKDEHKMVGKNDKKNCEEIGAPKVVDHHDKLLVCGAIIVADLRLQVLRETEFILFVGVAHNKMLTKFSSGAYRKRAFNCKSKFITEREEAGRCNFSVKPLKSKRRGSEKNGRYAAIMLSESRIKVAAEARAAATAAMLFSIIKILLKMGQNGYNGHDTWPALISLVPP